MGKFDDVLLASDFDNTILNTERPRRTGGGRPLCRGHRPGAAGVPDVCGQGADERPGHRVQRRGAV